MAKHDLIRRGTTVNQTIPSIIGNARVLTKTSNNILTLTANNTFTGQPITVIQGTLFCGNGVTTGNIIPSNKNIQINAGTTFTYRPGSNAVTHTGTITGTGLFNVVATAPASLFLNGSTMSTFAGVVMAGRLVLQNVADSSALASYIVTSPGFIAGNNAVTYNIGALAGSGQMLSIGAGTVAWSIGARNNNTTFTGTFVAAATNHSFTKVGTGTLTLTGRSTMNGTITISAGTLLLNRINAVTVPTATPIVNNSILSFGHSIGTITHSSVISGTGSVIKAGAGNLILTGNSSWSGGTTINAGTLTISSLNGLGGGGAVTLNGSGTTLTYTTNTTATRTVTLNALTVVNRGGFAHSGTTFVNLGGTLNP